MKRILLYITLLCTANTLVAQQNRIDYIREKILDCTDRTVLVAAHRGDWRNAPENSLLAIEKAIEMGVDIVEVDVQKTSDGQVILMHDETLSRTTTGVGWIADCKLDSIRTLFLKNGINTATRQRVPTLEEALLLAKGRVFLMLDKADRMVEEVYDVLKKTGTTDQVIMRTAFPYVDARVIFHEYINEAILMPGIELDSQYADSDVEAYLSFFRPKIFELIYSDDKNPLPLQMKDRLLGRAKIWYSTLWDELVGGHDDERALTDIEGAYGYVVDVLGANIIQTDRPALLLKYLRDRGLHD